jgi:hypothetical protein
MWTYTARRAASTSTKDAPALSALKLGVQRNRKRVFIRKTRVVRLPRPNETINL